MYVTFVHCSGPQRVEILPARYMVRQYGCGDSDSVTREVHVSSMLHQLHLTLELMPV